VKARLGAALYPGELKRRHRVKAKVKVGEIGMQEDLDNCLRKSSIQGGNFYHTLCRMQVAGYPSHPWVDFLIPYMAGSLRVDKVEAMEQNVVEQHDWKCPQKLAAVRFQFGDVREHAVAFVVSRDQGRVHDVLVLFSTSLKLMVMALL